jgi:hypothetical protein
MEPSEHLRGHRKPASVKRGASFPGGLVCGVEKDRSGISRSSHARLERSPATRGMRSRAGVIVGGQPSPFLAGGLLNHTSFRLRSRARARGGCLPFRSVNAYPMHDAPAKSHNSQSDCDRTNPTPQKTDHRHPTARERASDGLSRPHRRFAQVVAVYLFRPKRTGWNHPIPPEGKRLFYQCSARSEHRRRPRDSQRLVTSPQIVHPGQRL